MYCICNRMCQQRVGRALLKSLKDLFKVRLVFLDQIWKDLKLFVTVPDFYFNFINVFLFIQHKLYIALWVKDVHWSLPYSNYEWSLKTQQKPVIQNCYSKHHVLVLNATLKETRNSKKFEKGFQGLCEPCKHCVGCFGVWFPNKLYSGETINLYQVHFYVFIRKTILWVQKRNINSVNQ